MKSYVYRFSCQQQLADDIGHDRLHDQIDNTTSILIQIYTGHTDRVACKDIAQQLRSHFPNAVIAGATTAGEIYNGDALALETVITITLFEHTELTSVLIDSSCTEQTEKQLIGFLYRSEAAKGALLLNTPLTQNSDRLTHLIADALPATTLMGGGAGDNGAMKTALIFDDETVSDNALILVLMHSTRLSIAPHAHLHWLPLGKKMQITRASKWKIHTIDHQPAFNVYAKYLGIEYDPETFFLETLEFPLLIKKGENYLARVPVMCHKDGSLSFISDVNTGDEIQLGYGSVQHILDQTQSVADYFKAQQPEAIFVFSCGCRRFFLQEETRIESELLQQIAPTSGFFTAGEFYRDRNTDDVLNLTFTAYGLRETSEELPHSETCIQNNRSTELPANNDLYQTKHLRIVDRLSHFLNATTDELNTALTANEAANSSAIFICNNRATILFKNQIAADLLEDSDIFELRNDQLYLQGKNIQQVVNGAFAEHPVKKIPQHQTSILLASQMNHSYRLLIKSWKNQEAFAGDSSHTHITVDRISGSRLPDASQVASLLPLTPTEAERCLALCRGKNIKLIAEESGNTEGTVRQQVKGAMSKLKCNSQVELISYLLHHFL